jgi:hypothetical protein
LGGWTDARLKGFYVKEFDNLEDAQIEAYKYPNLDWSYLVALQSSSYEKLNGIMKEFLGSLDIVHEYEPKQLNAAEAKDIMFNRVKKYGERFTLSYNFNDLITLKIVNPFSKNLREIAKLLQNRPELNLIKQYNKSGVIYMIGETDVNTTYQIILCPSLINHWGKWIQMNNHLPEEVVEESLDDVIKQQEILDSNLILR